MSACEHCGARCESGDPHPCCDFWVAEPEWNHHPLVHLSPCPACAESERERRQRGRAKV